MPSFDPRLSAVRAVVTHGCFWEVPKYHVLPSHMGFNRISLSVALLHELVNKLPSHSGNYFKASHSFQALDPVLVYPGTVCKGGVGR